jgi:exodeoxyribonuclease VII large subunit
VNGRVNCYEKTGVYQVYATKMTLDGIGSLYERFVRLQDQLRTNGYFDEAHKKKIPADPKKVAVVTSPTGAAVRDIISIITRRSPATKLVVCPVLVQGENAFRDISSMIDYINAAMADIEVIIVARGGGSIEDLWAFNEQAVADSVYRSRIPIISAVGHETDFTICDFVSDLRAPTPSAAAELCVPDRGSRMELLSRARQQLREHLNRKVSRAELDITQRKNAYVFTHPLELFQKKEMELDFAAEKLSTLMNTKLNTFMSALLSKKLLCESLSYEEGLKRGFGVILKNNEIISADLIVSGDDVHLLSRSALAKIHVNEVKEREN